MAEDGGGPLHEDVDVRRGTVRGGPPRKGQQILDDSAHAGSLMHDLREVLFEIRYAFRRDTGIGEDPLHEHGKVQDTRDRVVDFVGHAGRELAERGKPVAVDQFLVRHSQLFGALSHLRFQRLRESRVLLQRVFEADAHTCRKHGPAPRSPVPPSRARAYRDPWHSPTSRRQ